MNTVTFHCGDVRDVMSSMPDHSVDLLVTSPPFLALRSYLPADHPDKHREIGSEPTPAAYLDTMLELTAEWRRLVTATGSICVEIGDTYSGSTSKGGPGIDGTGSHHETREDTYDNRRTPEGWPLAKSLCGIPTLYTWSLAYGRNLLTGADSPAGRLRVRNLLTWTRPNPPVGALGDKYRPATSFVTVACASDRRWFDLDAVRTEPTTRERHDDYSTGKVAKGGRDNAHGNVVAGTGIVTASNPAGAPPLDWWDANDWQPLHRLPTAPYHGTHYAAYPVTLPRRLIESMCPKEVCAVCGEGRRRIVRTDGYVDNSGRPAAMDMNRPRMVDPRTRQFTPAGQDSSAHRLATTLGWSDCGHGNYRPGIVLDPFAGSGTTAVAAAQCGRDAVLIDLDESNLGLIRQRLAETMLIVNERRDGNTWTWTVNAQMPGTKGEAAGQLSMFADEEAI